MQYFFNTLTITLLIVSDCLSTNEIIYSYKNSIAVVYMHKPSHFKNLQTIMCEVNTFDNLFFYIDVFYLTSYKPFTFRVKDGLFMPWWGVYRIHGIELTRWNRHGMNFDIRSNRFTHTTV